MSEKRVSRIQRETDRVICAVQSDLEDILRDVPEHGSILLLRESGNMNIWQFEDGFKRELPKHV